MHKDHNSNEVYSKCFISCSGWRHVAQGRERQLTIMILFYLLDAVYGNFANIVDSLSYLDSCSEVCMMNKKIRDQNII